MSEKQSSSAKQWIVVASGYVYNGGNNRAVYSVTFSFLSFYIMIFTERKKATKTDCNNSQKFTFAQLPRVWQLTHGQPQKPSGYLFIARLHTHTHTHTCIYIRIYIYIYIWGFPLIFIFCFVIRISSFIRANMDGLFVRWGLKKKFPPPFSVYISISINMALNCQLLVNTAKRTSSAVFSFFSLFSRSIQHKTK